MLRPLPVSRIWGVGNKTQQLLDKLGLKTIGDIQDLPPGWLEARIGTAGRLFWELARGIDERAIEPDYERKSIGREETFPQDTNDITFLENLIARFAAELGYKLRKAELKAATITIKLRYSNFKTITRRKSIPPCNSDTIITEQAAELLHQSYAGRKALRLFGLSLSNLSPAALPEQGTLFTSGLTAEQANIDQLMDDIRERFGPQAITRGNLLSDNKEQ